jgi:hypothetical protein
MELDQSGTQVWELHQYLIGLRRRHPWLHTARTSALRLNNKHFVYRVQRNDDALLVALNIDDEPLRVSLPEFGIPHARVVAGSTAPPEQVLDTVVVEAHGWRILSPI